MPELAGAYGAIANDGVRMPLSIVESCTKPRRHRRRAGTPRARARDQREHLGADARRCSRTCPCRRTYAKAIEIPGYRIGGKTGTGEKSDGNGGYKPGVYYTTMVGFAPADDPQYVVVVTLDEPTKVTSSAANATGVPEGHDPGSQDLPRHALDDGAGAAAQVRVTLSGSEPENPR